MYNCADNTLNKTFKAFELCKPQNAQTQTGRTKRVTGFTTEEQARFDVKKKKLKKNIAYQNGISKCCFGAVLLFIGCQLAFRGFKSKAFANVDEIKSLASKMEIKHGLDKKGLKIYILDKTIELAKPNANKKIIEQVYKETKDGVFDLGFNKVIVWKEAMDSIFHEIGHAVTFNKKYGKSFQNAALKLPFFAVVPGVCSLTDTTSSDKSEGWRKKMYKFDDALKNNAGKLAFACFVPQILDETMASGYALKFLSKESKVLMKKNLPLLLPALGTYLINGIAAGVATSSIVNRVNRFWLQKSMYDDLRSAESRLKFDDTVSPNIAVIDGFSEKTIAIDSDKKADISHGEMVVSIIKSGLPNAKIAKINTSFDENTVNEALKNLLDSPEKIDALNLSKSSDIKYKELSELVGIKITPKNIAQHKSEIKKRFFASSHKEAGVLKEIVEKLERLSSRGTKIYIAAGNNNDKTFNLYTLADNVDVIGATKKYGTIAPFSAKNNLVTQYVRGAYRSKAIRDNDGKIVGFDINDDGKIEVNTSDTTSKTKTPSFMDLNGTSYASPTALVRDLRRVIK